MSRVEEMEKERRKLDKQLDTALEKTKAANHGQEVLEAKIKVWISIKLLKWHLIPIVTSNFESQRGGGGGLGSWRTLDIMLSAHFLPHENMFQIQEQEREAELDKETITSRMTTLAPSASFYVKNRTAGSDRPSYMPMRSASMRETSYRYLINNSDICLKLKKSFLLFHIMSFLCFFVPYRLMLLVPP